MSEENPWHPHKSMWDALHDGAIERRREQQFDAWMGWIGLEGPILHPEHYNDDEPALD